MENQNKNKTYIYLLLAFFALFVATGLFVAFRSNKASNVPGSSTTSTNSPATLKQENLVIPTLKPTSGTLTLISKLVSYTVNSTAEIVLTGNSNDKNIVGYDAVIFYDPLSFEFMEAKSNLPDFQIYSYNRGNYLLLTAVKSVSSNSQTILGSGSNSQPMATLSFKSKKAGKFNFSLRQSVDKDTTDLVTDQTEVMSPALTDITVEVK